VSTGSGTRGWKINPILSYLAEEFPGHVVECAPVPEQLADRFVLVTGDRAEHTLLVRRSWFDAYHADWKIVAALREQMVADRLRTARAGSVELIAG
jgi:hypothetical protein